MTNVTTVRIDPLTLRVLLNAAEQRLERIEDALQRADGPRYDALAAQRADLLRVIERRR